MKKVIPLVADAMSRAQDETGEASCSRPTSLLMIITKCVPVLTTFWKPLLENASHVAFLVDGYVGGPGMVTTARRQYPDQYVHYQRAGHGAVTSPSSVRGYTAFVLAKMSRLMGASGIHVGTMGYGKMEGV